MLIKPLEESKSDKIHHKVQEVVFKLGQTVDPITGRRCRGTEFIDTSNRRFERNLLDPDAKGTL